MAVPIPKPPIVLVGEQMKELVRKFITHNSGAVTVDWVVVTAFAIAIALSVAAAISPGLKERGTKIVDPVSISTAF